MQYNRPEEVAYSDYHVYKRWGVRGWESFDSMKEYVVHPSSVLVLEWGLGGELWSSRITESCFESVWGVDRLEGEEVDVLPFVPLWTGRIGLCSPYLPFFFFLHHTFS